MSNRAATRLTAPRLADRGLLRAGECLYGRAVDARVQGDARAFRGSAAQGRGPAFVELFAGCARLSGAVLDAGVRVGSPIDVSRHAAFDVSGRQAQRVVLRWLSRGDVSVLWIATPCTAWSVANQAPSEAREASGRLLADFTAKLIVLCLDFNVPFVLENPDGSRL